MTQHREPTESEKALARDMERIGADFQRAFGHLGRAFEKTVTGLQQSRPALVRATEPQPGWFDRQILKVTKVADKWRKR
jgi:hypothetical protein